MYPLLVENYHYVRAASVRQSPSARAVFDQTRLWQRDMYEHYQLGGGSPAKAAL